MERERVRLVDGSWVSGSIGVSAAGVLRSDGEESLAIAVVLRGVEEGGEVHGVPGGSPYYLAISYHVSV